MTRSTITTHIKMRHSTNDSTQTQYEETTKQIKHK